jgi:hypothetical protein
MKKKTSTERVKKFRKANPWHRLVEYAKRRCTDVEHREYHRYGGRGIKCVLTYLECKDLFIRDNGHALNRPSLDRKNPALDYTFDNCQIIEYEENIKRRGPVEMAPAEAPTEEGEWTE